MNEEHEINNLIKKLEPEAAMPSLTFEARLKKRMLAKNRGPIWNRINNNFRGFIYGMQGVPANNFGFLTFGVLFLGVLMAGLFFWKLNQNYTIFEQPNELSSQESYAVLTNVFKNNPQALLSTGTQSGLLAELMDNQPAAGAVTLSNSVQMQPAAVAPVAISKNYNFFHISYTRTLGPMANTCSTLAPKNVRLETYTYELSANNSVNSNYFKAVEYDNTDNINYISITNNTGSILYEGGLYAVRIPPVAITENTAGVLPVNVVLSQQIAVAPTDEPLQQIFGPDAIVSKTNIDGKTYFLVTVISSDSTSACNAGSNNSQTPVYIVHTIDPDQNYQVISSAYYYGSVLPENLILKSTNSYERANLSPDDALKQYFTLESTIHKTILIKDYGNSTPNFTDLTTIDNAVNVSMNTLLNNPIQVLLLADQPKTFSTYHDTSLDHNNFRKISGYVWDQAFYSNANWLKNREAIEAAQSDFTLIQYSQLIYTDADTSINYSVSLPGQITSACNNSSATTITVNGKSIVAQQVQNGNQIVCFDYQGMYYELKINKVLSRPLLFITLDAQEKSAQTTLRSMLHDVYNKWAATPVTFTTPAVKVTP